MNVIFKNNSIYKDELSIKAKEHNRLMEIHYQKEIQLSYSNSKIYNEDFILSEKKNTGNIPNIQIVDTDTVSALFMIKDIFNKNSTGILNFASYKHPGGMFLKGSTAQEEALCHESILYNVLYKFNDSYYKENREKYKTVGNYYSNRGIYSPMVLFMHNDKNTFTNVITVASPNKRYNPYHFIDRNINSQSLDSRIKFILDIAEDNNLKTFILGAFGCGVFKQDPKEVASIFKKYLLSRFYNFENIIFAIPYGNNYEEFVKVFKDTLFGFFMD